MTPSWLSVSGWFTIETFSLRETESNSPKKATGLGCLSSRRIGGEYPLKGDFRLLSFNPILNLLADHLGKTPNTTSTTIRGTSSPRKSRQDHGARIIEWNASGTDLSIQSHGKYYAVNTISDPTIM